MESKKCKHLNVLTVQPIQCMLTVPGFVVVNKYAEIITPNH